MKDVKTIKKLLRVPTDVFYVKYLQLLNPLFPVELTMKEIEVLSSFMALDKSIIGESIINTLSRKLVKNKLGLSSAGLTNYITSIVDKGYLIKNPLTGILKLNPYVNVDSDILKFEIILDKNEN